MDFGLSEEQVMLQDTVRGFIESECPIARVRELFDADSAWDPALWKGLTELGLTGILVSEEHGGAGLELLDLALVAEVMGESALPGPFLMHAIASLALALGGSDAQRGAWLPRLAAGETVATLAIAEGDQGWAEKDWSCRISGDRISGLKKLAPDAAQADLLVVATGDGGLALVARDGPGVALSPFEGLDRTRRMASIALEDAPCEVLPAGTQAWPRARDAALVVLAADAFGAASRLIRATVDYLSEREQFGTRLVQFQGIKHQLANLLTALEPARALYWYAAHVFDHTPEAAPRAAALAKSHLTDRAMDVAREAVELHGGIGFTWECDVHLWYKRILFDRGWLGGPDLHRDRAADLAGW
jgi:alkylation response protein AidB-like acyl-CoA dehydrogenase